MNGEQLKNNQLFAVRGLLGSNCGHSQRVLDVGVVGLPLPSVMDEWDKPQNHTNGRTVPREHQAIGLRPKRSLAVAAFHCGFTIGLCFLTASGTAQSSRLDAFRNLLSSVQPVKLLRFSETDCQSGHQRHFLAACDTNDFYLREYTLDEDPFVLISSNRVAHSANFYGRSGDVYWEINNTEINKTVVRDPVVNWCQLGAKTAKALIDSVLNLGVSGRAVKRGGFVWNPTNETRFLVQLADGVTFTPVGGSPRTRVGGYIEVKQGFVSKLETIGGTVYYKYATNLPVPVGIPTTIIVGKSESNCDRIFRIEELQFGDLANAAGVFAPESKFVTSSIASSVFITNGVRLVHGVNGLILPPPLPSPSSKWAQMHRTTIRWSVLSAMGLSVICVIALCFRRSVK